MIIRPTRQPATRQRPTCQRPPRPSALRAWLLHAGLLAGAGAMALGTGAQARAPDRAPDSGPGPAAQSGHAPHAMIAAANPLAVAAGLKVLRAGGSAVDAAVAVQAVLGLVEPQSSGVGGGAFLVYHDAKTGRTLVFDGRETAPKGASPRQFIGADGQPLPFAQAVMGGISSGVPGAIAMLDVAQRAHGKLPWARLFDSARLLAREGFLVSPRLAALIGADAPQAHSPDARAYFTHADGSLYKAGELLKNPAYAASLGAIARARTAGLLQGRIARDIVARLAQGPLPSTMTMADLAGYRVVERAALCRPYHRWQVCTAPAPAGGLPLQEALGILAHTDIASRGPADEKAWFEFAQASRLAYADRDRYEGDPAFVTVPTAGLLASDYLAKRAALIGERMGEAPYGQPAGAPNRAPDATLEPGGTSHMVIVDAAGNVVSMTTTVESLFGNGRMVDGFFLNNQLTDFAFSPTIADGTLAANALAPGKRPRSSMSPTIVLSPQGRFVAAVGSPGGSSIIAYTLKALVAMLDWHMAPQAALALPNLVAHGGSITADPFPADITQGLAARAMVLDVAHGENSGLHAIVAQKGGYEGGADPRREGVARGF